MADWICPDCGGHAGFHFVMEHGASDDYIGAGGWRADRDAGAAG